jgi:hypothetical protein
MTLALDVAEIVWGTRRWALFEGDCLDVLDRMPSACVDAIVTDPPAGIGFMGREWDEDRGGREEWITWLSLRLREAHRVLKPGGHALVWGLPRTTHWTATGIELAGFEIRDRLSHFFGKGYAKSLDMPREAIHRGKPYPNPDPAAYELAGWMAEHRKGWGTGLKPACEDWWLARKKPIGPIVQNVRELGTGAINIDGARVRHASPEDFAKHVATVAGIKARGGSFDNSWKNSSDLSGASDVNEAGRFPSHLLITHAPGCKKVGSKRVKVGHGWYETDRTPSAFTGPETSPVHYGDEDGLETIEDWQCVDGCPAKLLNAQAGEDGAAHYFTQFEYEDVSAFDPFFYTPKASTSERERGCAHLPLVNLTGREEGSAGANNPRAGTGRKGKRHNAHPTVKSIALMRWLCRLVTPPNGIVLDLFAGSGSTLVACSAERFRSIGIELDPVSIAIARARFTADAPLLNRGAGL